MPFYYFQDAHVAYKFSLLLFFFDSGSDDSKVLLPVFFPHRDFLYCGIVVRVGRMCVAPQGD